MKSGNAITLLLWIISALLHPHTHHLVHGASDPDLHEIPEEALPTSSGYLDVKKPSGASIFYVYYEAQSPEGPLSETPVVLWLQGGPGCSGLVGNFFEQGPWVIGEDQRFYPNEGTWNRIYGVLFVDQPVGTGFSTAPTPEDIPTSDEEVGRDLYVALEAFYSARPTFRRRPLYITGESYAGKYVPDVGYYILQNTASGAIAPSFDLKGLAIGNGLTHPVEQIPEYAPAAFYMGLIDSSSKLELDKIADSVVADIEAGRYDLAHDARSQVMRTLYNLTGLATLLDIRRTLDYYTYPNGSTWLWPVLNSPALKQALGVVGDAVWEDCTDVVDEAFRNQTMRSTKFMVEKALTELPVLLYQGQFDLQDGVASNEAWMRHIDWTGAEGFWSTPRRVWSLSGDTAGYVRAHGNLSHVVILGAGHLVPADQGVRTQKMLEAWIGGALDTLGSSESLISDEECLMERHSNWSRRRKRMSS